VAFVSGYRGNSNDPELQRRPPHGWHQTKPKYGDLIAWERDDGKLFAELEVQPVEEGAVLALITVNNETGEYGFEPPDQDVFTRQRDAIRGARKWMRRHS